MRKRLGMLLFALLVPAICFAATIRTALDRDTVGANGIVTLTITVEGDSAEVDLAPLHETGDFQVLSQSSSTNLSIGRGGVSRQTVYGYALHPLRSGDLVIPALPVRLGKETLQTEPQSLHVREAKTPGDRGGAASDQPPPQGQTGTRPKSGAPSQRFRPGPDTDAKGSPLIMVDARFAKPQVWQGETVAYTVAVAIGGQASNFQLETPEFKNFAARELPDRNQYTDTINGRRYEVVETTWLLTPRAAEKISLGPATLHCDVVQRDRRGPGDLFDQFFNDPFFSQSPFMFGQRVEKREFSSSSTELEVKPLPPYGGQGRFSGLVGQFTASASLEKSEVAAGESITLTVTVTGTGNVMDAPEPLLQLPAQVKVYKDAPQEHVDASPDGYAGRKTFRYALVPVEPGKVQVPSLTFVTFDPKSGQYEEISTPPLSLNVLLAAVKEQAVVAEPPAAPAQAQPERKHVEFKHKDVLPLKDTELVFQKRTPLTPLALALLLAAPILAWVGLVAGAGRLTRKQTPARAMAERAATLLKEAAANADPAQSLSACSRALIAAINARTGQSSESLTYAEAETALLSCGIAEPQCKTIRELLEALDAARYGAGHSTDIGPLLDATRKAVRSLCP